jgi:hypothetical protein
VAASRWPKGFSSNVNDEMVAASSATNMWTFPTVSGTTKVVQYGLHWNGKSWAKYTFSNQLLGTAVFSGTNAWLFGDGVPKVPTLGWGPPTAARYNGHAWKSVSVPGVVTSLSALSASDMWAAGPSAKTAGDSGAAVNFLAMHWNGKAWTSLSIPKVAPVNGSAWTVNGIVATSASNVWVKESVDVNPGNGTGPAGAALLHWNGKKWTTTKNMSYYFHGLASDGSGGLWLSASKSQAPDVRGYIAHYTGGHWSYQAAPTESGYADSAPGLISIPGTKSLWGLASLDPTGHGINESAILKYGP